MIFSNSLFVSFWGLLTSTLSHPSNCVWIIGFYRLLVKALMSSALTSTIRDAVLLVLGLCVVLCDLPGSTCSSDGKGEVRYLATGLRIQKMPRTSFSLPHFLNSLAFPPTFLLPSWHHNWRRLPPPLPTPHTVTHHLQSHLSLSLPWHLTILRWSSSRSQFKDKFGSLDS